MKIKEIFILFFGFVLALAFLLFGLSYSKSDHVTGMAVIGETNNSYVGYIVFAILALLTLFFILKNFYKEDSNKKGVSKKEDFWLMGRE